MTSLRCAIGEARAARRRPRRGRPRRPAVVPPRRGERSPRRRRRSRSPPTTGAAATRCDSTVGVAPAADRAVTRAPGRVARTARARRTSTLQGSAADIDTTEGLAQWQNRLVNEFTVNRPIDEAWPIICDVERIAPCLPGAQLEEIEGDMYRGKCQGQARRRRHRVRGRGPVRRARRRRPTAPSSTPRAATPRDRATPPPTSTPRLEALSPTSTKCIVTDRPAHPGKVAQFGRGMMGDVSKKLMDQFAANLNKMLDEHRARAPRSTAGDGRGWARVPARRTLRIRRVRPAATPATRPVGERRAAAEPPRRCARSTARPPSRSSWRDGRPGVLKRLAPGARGRARCCCWCCAAGADRTTWATTDAADAAVRARRREPQGRFTVVARDAAGEPVVIRNAPLLDDGTPMPTLYWLVAPDEVCASAGSRPRAASTPPRARSIRDVVASPRPLCRRARRRDPAEHDGPRPHGGVGGTRTGVKCLHAHWAWHLAGGDDPVGRWIEASSAAADARARGEGVTVAVERDRTTITIRHARIGRDPVGRRQSHRRVLSDPDPPGPALTNALGIVDDHLDDVEREHPSVLDTTVFEFSGEAVAAPRRCRGRRPRRRRRVRAQPRGRPRRSSGSSPPRPAADRAPNPGLPFEHVGTIVATCCIVLAVMRRLHLDQVTIVTRRRHQPA